MSPQRYREKSDALRAEYYRRIEQWRESVDPSIIHELNRRRLAKGMTRLRGINRGEGVKRPVTGYHRYVHNYTYLAVTVLSKVLVTMSTYEMSTQGRRKIIKLISALYLSAPQVNGRQ
jgi:hypothetical protein